MCKVQNTGVKAKQRAVALQLVWALVSKLTTVSLVSAVLTVVLLITSPAHRDAASTGTGKEGRRTLCFPAPWQSDREVREETWRS